MSSSEHNQASQPAAWQPRIVAFLCNWCSYAGADLAGVGRMKYPPSIRVIRVPCSGRVSPLYILSALQRGADGVLVSGCHPGDCHYLTGNLVARRRFAMMNALLDYVGIEPGRVLFTWVSAAEGQRFADVVGRVTERIRELGPNHKLVRRIQTEDSNAVALAGFQSAREGPNDETNNRDGRGGTKADGCACCASIASAPPA